MLSQAYWHFHCLECGFGEGRKVRLHRWDVIEVEQLAAA
jgi:ribosomal protein L37E